MEALEQTLFRFWSSCLVCLRRSAMLTGNPYSTEAYLRGFYHGLRDILGNPPGPELEFHHYPTSLEGEQPDGVLLAQEYWIATRVFENELVAVWSPQEEAPVELTSCDPDCMWLSSQPGSIWGRIYRKPLRPDRPLEKMALESTKRALETYPEAITQLEQLPDQRPVFLSGTDYRCFTDDELNTLTGDWPALASAAHRDRRENYLRTAAENSADPRVWTWHALELVTNRSFPGFDEVPGSNRERWSALENLKSLDPDNGAAELLEAFLFLKVGLVSECVAQLARAFRRERMTFYCRDRWDLLWNTSRNLGWTVEQSRHLVLGSTAVLLFPISVFRKELVNTKARASLKKLALQEMKQPLLMQQMLGCSLLAALEPRSRTAAEFRKRSQQNLDFIRRLLPGRLTEQRWDSYFFEVINRSENEAIERLREEGYEPQGAGDSWLESILGPIKGEANP